MITAMAVAGKNAMVMIEMVFMAALSSILARAMAWLMRVSRCDMRLLS